MMLMTLMTLMTLMMLMMMLMLMLMMLMMLIVVQDDGNLHQRQLATDGATDRTTTVPAPVHEDIRAAADDVDSDRLQATGPCKRPFLCSY